MHRILFCLQFFTGCLILFLCALFGLNSSKTCFVRSVWPLWPQRDNHSSQFDGLRSGYPTRPWWRERSERRRRWRPLLWSSELWCHNAGKCGRLPSLTPASDSSLKCRVGLKLLWGWYLTLWSMLCHVKDPFSNYHPPVHWVGLPDWVVWRWACRNSKIYRGSCISPGLWVSPGQGRWVAVAVATGGDQTLFS